MPPLTELPSAESVKMLLIGDSGAGKTGALCSLVDAGYNLRILDFDNGLDVLRNYVKDKERLSSVLVEQCIDDLKMKGGATQAIGGVKAFAKAMEYLDCWPGLDIGVDEWGPMDVLVIDSLTFMSQAAMRRILALKGDLNTNPSQPQWGDAQRLVSNALTILYSPRVRCNVVITAHVTYIGNEGDTALRGYPASLGKSLSPTIPRFFNTMVLCQTRGSGENRRREIITRSTNMMDLKVPAKVPSELPLETGLATIFEAVRGA